MPPTTPLPTITAAITDDDGKGLRLAWAVTRRGVAANMAEQALEQLAALEARSPEYRALNRRVNAYDLVQFRELWRLRAVLAGNADTFDAVWHRAGSLPGDYWRMMDDGEDLDSLESKECARRFWTLAGGLCAEPNVVLGALTDTAVGFHPNTQGARAALSGMPPALIKAHASYRDEAQAAYAVALEGTVGRLGEPLGKKRRLNEDQEHIKMLTEQSARAHEAKMAIADEALRRGLFPQAVGDLDWAKALLKLDADRSLTASKGPEELEWRRHRPKDGAGRHLAGTPEAETPQAGAFDTEDTEATAENEPDKEDARVALTKMLGTPDVLAAIKTWPGCKEERIGAVLDALRLLIWHEPQLRDEHRRQQKRSKQSDDAKLRRNLAFMPHRIYRLALEAADPGAYKGGTEQARNKALDRERAFVADAMLHLLETVSPDLRVSAVWWRLYLPAQVAMVTCAVLELNASGISKGRDTVCAKRAAGGLGVIGGSINASDRFEHGRLVRSSYDIAAMFNLWRRVGACLDKLATDNNRVPAEAASVLAAANHDYAIALDRAGRSIVEGGARVLGSLTEQALEHATGGEGAETQSHRDTGRARLERRVKTTIMAIRELETAPFPVSRETLGAVKQSKLAMREIVLPKLDGAQGHPWAGELCKLIIEL